MWYAAVMRFLRRRLVLGVIFVLSLTYCIVSLLREGGPVGDISDLQMTRQHPFIWRTIEEIHNESDSSATCRNSVQGRVLIVDDRGYVCQRSGMLWNGCCSVTSDTFMQYSCDTCGDNYCCAIYEHCVSCCLHPDKKELLQGVLDRVSERHSAILASVRDHFELCLAKCRTNSQSVQHENTYRNPRAKHCYADNEV